MMHTTVIATWLLLVLVLIVVHSNVVVLANDVARLDDASRGMVDRLFSKIRGHADAPQSWEDNLLPEMEQSFLGTAEASAATKHAGVPTHENHGRHRALRWLVFEDGASTSLSDHEYDSALLQRYALATIYYSTNGDEWTRCSKAAGIDAEGVFNSPCEGGYGARFLSSTSHLQWSGVMGRNGVITMLDLSGRGVAASTFLPPELAILGPSLELLWVHDNVELGGTLPGYIGTEFTNLASLAVHNTGMSGTVPNSMYTLPKLTSLRLYGSNFSGTLSSDIGKLGGLKWLWVHNNHFVGTVPSELGLLSKLEGLTLHGNQFSPVATTAYNNTTEDYGGGGGGSLTTNVIPDTVCNLTKYDLRYLWTDCEVGSIVSRRVEVDDGEKEVERLVMPEVGMVHACLCCTRCFPPPDSVGSDNSILRGNLSE